MHRFLKEFELSTYVHDLPQLFSSDFGEILGELVKPTLQGSLKYTSNAHWCEPIDPRQVKDWRISAGSILKLPKSYTRSSFRSIHLVELRKLYAVLYPTGLIFINSMYRKYTKG